MSPYLGDGGGTSTRRAAEAARAAERATQRHGHAGPSGADLIAAERRRQIDEEGYAAYHDAAHETQELAVAAWCYLGAYVGPLLPDSTPPDWPWDGTDWKPTLGDPVRRLVKAGALIAAEIDRLAAQA